MITVIGCGGAPASGKTTLFRAFMEHGNPMWFQMKQKLMIWSEDSVRKIAVLGDYSKYGSFGGTDKLSMAVQPQALKFIADASNNSAQSGWTYLFEGDRLFTASFIHAVRGMPNVKSFWIILKASPVELKLRHAARQDTQTDKWLEGRSTKLKNIAAIIPIGEWQHNLPSHTEECVQRLLNLCGQY